MKFKVFIDISLSHWHRSKSLLLPCYKDQFPKSEAIIDGRSSTGICHGHISGASKLEKQYPEITARFF